MCGAVKIMFTVDVSQKQGDHADLPESIMFNTCGSSLDQVINTLGYFKGPGSGVYLISYIIL